jgi:hypothetical protein
LDDHDQTESVITIDRNSQPWTVDTGFERWLLIRRSRRDTTERAYYLVFTRAGTTLAELAGAAGLRWTIEECFQRAKEELGLDHCEARSWHGWHRHMTLCMAAAAFLVRLRPRFAARRSVNRTERVRHSPRSRPPPGPAQHAGNPRPHRQAVIAIDPVLVVRPGMVRLATTPSGQRG